jgi:uncharacterized repeat protein (TIGR01451 family)
MLAKGELMKFLRISFSTLAASLILSSTHLASAATFNVTRFDDPAPMAAPNGCLSGGDCSLREAVLQANAGSGGDTVQLQVGTYNLTIAGPTTDGTTGSLLILKSVNILGAGQTATTINAVQPDLNDRVIKANSGGLQISISDLTIQGGIANPDSGGGIEDLDASGSLKLNNCIIQNNQAPNQGGAILSSASLEIQNCQINGNKALGNAGGGIFINQASASVTIANSQITGNTTTSLGGGGIAILSASDFSLSNTEISANHADSGVGGGILFQTVPTVTILNSSISNNQSSEGGGLEGLTATLQITNSTISGNQATGNFGGIFINASISAILSNVTISSNKANSDGVGGGAGGGIDNGGGPPPVLKNSIIFGNTDDGTAPDCEGTFSSGGFNFIGDLTGSNFPLGNTDDQIGPDPLLQGLANNGGPTPTMALGTGSPAIDGGNPAGCTDGNGAPLTTDQRGQTRPIGAHCDVGAFEAGSADLEVTKVADPDPVKAGDQLTYNITVLNNGPNKDFNVTLTDTLPSNVTIISTIPALGTCDTAGDVVTCKLGDMDPNDSIGVLIVVRAPSGGGTITNTASVTGSETDPDPNNNSVSIDTDVKKGGGCALMAGDQTSSGKFLPLAILGMAFAGIAMRRLGRS